MKFPALRSAIELLQCANNNPLQIMPAPNPAESFPARTFYKGRAVDWGRFLPLLVPAFVAAILLAEGMEQLFMLGHYYIFIVPLVTGLCVAGLIHVAVNVGHCRNPFVAGAAGFCAGVILYLGQYYSGMIHDLGPDVAARPDLLPSYIRLRMAIEVTRDIHESDDTPKKVTKADSYMNWFRFVGEFALVVGITMTVGIKRARKPYCDACRRWMLREVTPFAPAKTEELLEAFRSRSPRSLAALSAQAPYATIPNVSMAVDYCPTFKDGRSQDCPVYVSFKTLTMVPKTAVKDPFEQCKGKVLVRGMQIEREELAALAPRFKTFESIAGRSTVSALLPKEEPEEIAPDKDAVYAEITPLSPDHAGKILTKKTKWIGAALSLGVLAGLFIGLGLMICGLMLAFPDHPPEGGVSPTAMHLGIALIVLGGIPLLFSIVMGLADPSFFGNRYIRKVVLQEFARRTSLMVDPNDPEAVFVECVPKMNWGKMMLDNASDLGLMVVDQRRREIRFEGDKERWRIPAAAITYCGFEVHVQRNGNHTTKIFYAVIQANHRSGFWEAPLRPRGATGLFSGKRKKATKKLFEAIESIRGAQKPDVAARV